VCGVSCLRRIERGIGIAPPSRPLPWQLNIRLSFTTLYTFDIPKQNNRLSLEEKLQTLCGVLC
jgi:hypothetical protein